MIRNTSLKEDLNRVRDGMIAASQDCAQTSNWSQAEQFMRYGRELDAMAKAIDAMDSAEPPPQQRPSSRQGGLSNGVARKLPYYYREGDVLAKVGPSRDGSTYVHRVPRDHYDIVVTEIERINRQFGDTFATAALVDRCPIPKHEPLIVVAVLAESGCLRRIRRGHWATVNPGGLRADADAAWSRLSTTPYPL